MNNIYDITAAEKSYLQYFRNKQYIFKAPENWSEKEKIRFELNALLITLIRLMEDFDIYQSGNKLIYLMDSTEFMGYVDPARRIEDYVFKIKGEELPKNVLKKKTEYREYRYNVLFNMNLLKENSLDIPIFHERHLSEVLNSKVSLINSTNKYIHSFLNPLDDSYKFEDSESLINYIDQNGLYNVFEKITTNKKKTQRFNDLINNDKFTSVEYAEWKRILDVDEDVINKIKSVDFDTTMNNFFHMPYLDHYDFMLDQLGDRSSVDWIFAAVKTDNQILSFICRANHLLKQHNSKFRIALLSSNKYFNVYTKYIHDFLDSTNGYDDLNEYYRDILYVRYPTVLLNTINKTEEYWIDTKEIVEKKLIPVISGVLHKIKFSEITPQIASKLEEIASNWNEIRKAFIQHEHLEDLNEGNDEDIDGLGNNDKKSIDNLKKIRKEIVRIGYDSIHDYIFDISKNRINDLIQSYLLANSKTLLNEFYGEVKIGKQFKSNKDRYFIRSLKRGHSQHVFQFPIKIQNWVACKDGKLREIQNLKILKKESQVDYMYTCVLYSCILRDWDIVLSVAGELLEKNIRVELKEEILYIYSLALRFEICKNFSMKSWRNNLHHYLTKINNSIERAEKINRYNARLLMSKISFQLESFVLKYYYEHRTTNKSSFDWKNNDHFIFLKTEYETGVELSDLEKITDSHVFKDNLYLMYYKVLLSFYVFVKLSGLISEEVKLKSEKKEYLLNELIKFDNRVQGDRIVSKSLIKLCSNESPSPEEIKKCKDNLQEMNGGSFIKKFIFMPACKNLKRKFHNRKLKEYRDLPKEDS